MRHFQHAAFFIVVAMWGCGPAEQADPLPSWNEGPAKRSITEFVNNVTTEGSAAFVPLAERIAVFDNDGTLWSEQPAYFQLLFAIDRVRALAPEHPEWKTQQPFKAVLEGDMVTLAQSGVKGILELVMATHAGESTEQFQARVQQWLADAEHPRFGHPYTELVFQPMLEVLTYLRANGFKTYIVSGGGVDFVRVFSEKVYGIPPEQVIGSSLKSAFELRDGVPKIVRLPEIDFIDDKEEKPIAIQKIIGRRPIAAFGNSDGDHQMLQWTAAGQGARLMVLVHHTDGDREWAYDRQSHVGRLDKALDEADARGWTVVDMKQDWNRVYPFGE